MTHRWLWFPPSWLYSVIVSVVAVRNKNDLKPTVYLQTLATYDWLVSSQLTRVVRGSCGSMCFFLFLLFSSTSVHPGEGWNSAWRLSTELLLHNMRRGKVHLLIQDNVVLSRIVVINNNMTVGCLFRKETQSKHIVILFFTTHWWNIGLSTPTEL